MSATAALPTDTPAGPDLSRNPGHDLQESWRFRMIADADPGLLPRVVAPIAKLGLVPARCGFALRRDALAEIDLMVAGLTSGQAEHLRLVYAVMPMMRAVTLDRPGA